MADEVIDKEFVERVSKAVHDLSAAVLRIGEELDRSVGALKTAVLLAAEQESSQKHRAPVPGDG